MKIYDHPLENDSRVLVAGWMDLNCWGEGNIQLFEGAHAGIPQSVVNTKREPAKALGEFITPGVWRFLKNRASLLHGVWLTERGSRFPRSEEETSHRASPPPPPTTTTTQAATTVRQTERERDARVSWAQRKERRA